LLAAASDLYAQVQWAYLRIKHKQPRQDEWGSALKNLVESGSRRDCYQPARKNFPADEKQKEGWLAQTEKSVRGSARSSQVVHNVAAQERSNSGRDAEEGWEDSRTQPETIHSWDQQAALLTPRQLRLRNPPPTQPDHHHCAGRIRVRESADGKPRISSTGRRCCPAPASAPGPGS
jgi:hypothetical protein